MRQIKNFEDLVHYEYGEATAFPEKLEKEQYEFRDETQDDPMTWAKNYCAEHRVQFVLLRRFPKPFVSVWELYYVTE